MTFFGKTLNLLLIFGHMLRNYDEKMFSNILSLLHNFSSNWQNLLLKLKRRLGADCALE